MKFIVKSSDLLKSLQTVSGVLANNNSLPILNDFLLKLENNYLNIRASDLETTMSISLPIENVDEEGMIAVPSKIMLESLKAFPDMPVYFATKDANFSVELSIGEGKYRFAGHNPEEYPEFSELKDTSEINLNSQLIATAINHTLFAAGNDELRPVMAGVYVELTTDDLTFVATDAHKLVRYRRKDAKAEKSSTLILPKKPLNQLKVAIAGKDTDVIMKYNNTNVSFEFENIRLICRQIEGKYPNYEAVIPLSNPNKLVIDRLQLSSSLRRVAIFTNQSTNQVRMKISGQELIVSGEDTDYSNDAKERLSCNYEGEDLEIGFNSRFLLEMINNLENEMISLEMSEPSRAGLLFPVNNENENEDILMLVMPVMLNQ